MAIFEKLIKKTEQINENIGFLNHGPELQKGQPRIQRYFEGWTYKEHISASGRFGYERVYTGPYFIIELSRDEQKRQKRILAALTIVCCGLFAVSALMCGAAEESPFVRITQALSMICLLFLLWFTGVKLTAYKPLTIGEYREVAKGYLICTGITYVFLALNAVFILIHCFSDIFSLRELLSGVAGAGAALCVRYAFLTELKTVYQRKDEEHGFQGKMNQDRTE